VLEEGITEAGAFSSWLAAATSYSVNDLQMLPFYIYYSMFGFQRIGDSAWQAADMRSRGFLLGATAGRTTLNGEGLQHEDGHSMVQAGFIPNCRSYDPTFSYEVAVLLHEGMRRMLDEQVDEYWYLTLMNENYVHPAMPEGAAEGIVKGMYLLKNTSPATESGKAATSPARGGGRSSKAASGGGKPANQKHVQLMGSGTILRESIAAAELLEKDFGVTADIWSCPSFNELAREAADAERWNRLHPEAKKHRKPYITELLEDRQGPAIVATDYVRAYPEQVRAWVPMRYTVLGTDGFGRSDTRANLRRHFEVSRYHIAHAALAALAAEGVLTAKDVAKAIKLYEIDVERPNPIAL
jgi:pyruvate dehydrogenase E1 component